MASSSLVALLVFTLALFLRQGSCLEIQSLSLVGGRGEYIDVNAGFRYTLSCTYRSGYDDPVIKVTWYRHGSKVYEYRTTTDDISASGDLLGGVDMSPSDEPGSLHFTKLNYRLAGNYTCKVTSAQTTVEKTFYLHVVDVSPVPYDTSVNILKNMNAQLGADEENKYITYDLDQQPAEAQAAVEFEDAECTLVWSFKTPAIFPKPNVTCGYYSFNYDEVIHHLPAGLTMHQFMNGSWQASFDSTRVQVSSIPVEHRLGCSVKIADTTYREIVMTEDDFTVDALIDSAGCPALDDVTLMKRLLVEPRDSTVNCRGNFLPNDRASPAIVRVSCPSGYKAVFGDGLVEYDWWTELSCYEYDQLWRSYQEDVQEGQLMELRELPFCDPGVSSGHTLGSNVFASLALLFLVALLQNH